MVFSPFPPPGPRFSRFTGFLCPCSVKLCPSSGLIRALLPDNCRVGAGMAMVSNAIAGLTSGTGILHNPCPFPTTLWGNFSPPFTVILKWIKGGYTPIFIGTGPPSYRIFKGWPMRWWYGIIDEDQDPGNDGWLLHHGIVVNTVSLLPMDKQKDSKHLKATVTHSKSANMVFTSNPVFHGFQSAN